TNLFDALNFVAWAMMVCYLIIERKWGLRIVGVLAVALALVAMGEASLVTDKQIEPLVPALQSYWILIHVGMLFVSYSLFTLGAICALLYLVRVGTATAVLGAVQAAAAALLLALVGGTKLPLGATFAMAPGWQHQIASRLHPDKLLSVTTAVHVVPPGTDKAAKLLTPVAGVRPFLLRPSGCLLTARLRGRASAAPRDSRKLAVIPSRVIIAGWPLRTVGIVMGGMWANEAWGRFWGWDPKETWALITWVVYAGYLHTRITLGWAGRRPAAIAVFAFAVVVFTFMGVNLGLTGEGLHTYGAG